MSSILPIFRVGTHAHPTVGTHTAALDGIYEIIFDNTYSRYTRAYVKCRGQESWCWDLGEEKKQSSSCYVVSYLASIP